ncbi:MAG: DUF4423 domain-containing protein [Oligoflexia bacterium]|nr:DUF4423 domain-containing protein [Oligoflexia bacterium]
MSAIAIFEHTDYKQVIRQMLSQKGEWGEISRLAAAAGCQRSYLSKVINAHIHLTPDHGAGLCRYWGFDSQQSEYFLALLELARCASRTYRDYLEQKLARLRAQWEEASKRQGRTQVLTGEREALYYSSWQWTAIHIAVSIPELQTVSALSRRLQIPEPLVESVLFSLERMGLIRREAHRWKYSSPQLHVPADSPWVSLHHGNWRQRAVQDALQGPGTGALHYTNVQSMTEQAFMSIKGLFLKTIEEAVKIAGPAKEDELVTVNCDVFKV